MLGLKMQITLCVALVVISSGAVLRGDPATKPQQVHKEAADSKAKVAVPAKAAVTESKGKAVATPKAPVTKTAATSKAVVEKKEKPQDDAKTLETLGKSLTTMHKLKALFTKDRSAESSHDGAEKFTNGALSEELSKKDSQVWSAIETMLGATQDAMKQIKGKSKAERETVMKSLEDNLDKKAKDLANVTDDVSKKQQQQDEEYLLGLLIMHQKDWTMDKQLNATQEFMHNSSVLQDLYKHHDASKPLAPQLAAMMDVKDKAGVEKVQQHVAKISAAAAKAAHEETEAIMKRAKAKADMANADKLVAEATPKSAKVEQKAAKDAPAAAKAAPTAKSAAEKKKGVAKAASAAARAMFIQLASSITNQDCPYCAAQCVDKCHSAGKPYVQCLTDCADAGK